MSYIDLHSINNMKKYPAQTLHHCYCNQQVEQHYDPSENCEPSLCEKYWNRIDKKTGILNFHTGEMIMKNPLKQSKNN